MFKKTTLVVSVLTLALTASLGFSAEQDEADKKEQPKAKHAAKAEAGPRWRLAVMTYTFNRFTLFEAIDKSKELGARFVETYAWQKISSKHGDMQFNYDMPASAMDEVKQKLAETKVKLTNYYSSDLGVDAAKTKKVFEFCKAMGIEAIICEPDPKALPALDKLAEEYQVKVAIHNHPKDPKKPEYTNWNPDNVMKMLEGHSKWIGCCADNGHWERSGLSSVDCIKKYKGRLISLHFKDVNAKGPEAHDVPYGKGVVDLKGYLAELKAQGFSGVFSIEYEANMDNNTKDVGECITWFRHAKKEMGVK